MPAQPLILAPPEKLRRLAELRAKLRAQEADKLRDTDVFGLLGFIPNPGPQTRFLSLPDENIDVLYGGAAGGSKSTSLLMYALRTCIRYPGLQAFWFRRSFPELEHSVLRLLARYGYARSLGCTWRSDKYELRFPNGSALSFAHAKNVQEASAFLSAEVNLLVIDERTTLLPDVVDLLYTRVRSGAPGVPCLGIRSACVDEGDVLTETGWKPIQDVRAGELVQSLDPDGHMSLKPVEWIFAGPAADGLVRVDKRTLYMSMTPDHRVVHQRPGSRQHSITPWNELAGWGPGRHGDLPRRLAQMRAVAGLSQSQLLAALGWPARSKISRIEHAKQAPNADEIRAWAKACGRPEAARELVAMLEPIKSVRVVRASASYSADGQIQAPFGWGVDDYLAFLGLFLAEGCTSSTVRQSNYKTVITQCSEDNQPAIKDLLCRLTLPRFGAIGVLPSGNFRVRYYEEGARSRPRLPGGNYPGRPNLSKTFTTRREAEEFLASVRVPLKWNLSANGDFQITRKELWEHFRQFGKAHEKFVPRPILEHANPEQLRTLFDWMVFGDGSRSASGTAVQYFTTSPQLADDVAEIALKLGYMVQASSKDDGHPAHRTRYIVYCNGECRGTLIEHGRNGRREVATVPFAGDVYCIKVRDNENFFLRQRGRVWVSGNTNPGEIGHSRVLAEYIEPTRHGELELTDANQRRRVFIQARATDTPQLGDEYIRNLSGLPEKLRRAYLDGDWTVFAGQAFGEWRYDRHVIQPFPIPDTWRRYNGIDGGYRAPWCTMWGAEDPDGRIWFYREIYEAGVGETDQAKRILAAEADGEYVAVRYADDSLWAVSGESKASAVIYAENGVHLTPAGKGPGSRVTRVRRTRTYLAEAPACAHHRALGWATCPLMHVFPQCESLIRTLPTLPHASTGDPEDVDTHAEDHAYDAMSYLLINLGGGPEFTILPDQPAAGLDGEIEVLQPLGQFAYRPYADDPDWEYEEQAQRVIRTVRTIE